MRKSGEGSHDIACAEGSKLLAKIHSKIGPWVNEVIVGLVWTWSLHLFW